MRVKLVVLREQLDIIILEHEGARISDNVSYVGDLLWLVH